MKLILALVLALTVSACAENFHKPTTAGNAGTTALVAYAVSGAAASQYLALPLCATPPVYPCKTQAANERIAAADTAAYNAAKAADAAANDPTKQSAAVSAKASLDAELKSAKGGQP